MLPDLSSLDAGHAYFAFIQRLPGVRLASAALPGPCPEPTSCLHLIPAFRPRIPDSSYNTRPSPNAGLNTVRLLDVVHPRITSTVGAMAVTGTRATVLVGSNRRIVGGSRHVPP
ncbi:hypothetical protein Dimus_020349 [Dionaea muscipula]